MVKTLDFHSRVVSSILTRGIARQNTKINKELVKYADRTAENLHK